MYYVRDKKLTKYLAGILHDARAGTLRKTLWTHFPVEAKSFPRLNDAKEFISNYQLTDTCRVAG